MDISGSHGVSGVPAHWSKVQLQLVGASPNANPLTHAVGARESSHCTPCHIENNYVKLMEFELITWKKDEKSNIEATNPNACVKCYEEVKS